MQAQPTLINFVQEGGSVTSSRRSTGLLTKTRDWDLLVDLKKQLKFPAEMANTKRKKAKYQALMDECRQQGWMTWNLPVEVGSRGFAGQSLLRAFSILGINGMAKRLSQTSVSKQRQHLGCGRRESSDGQLTQLLAKTDHLGRRTSGGCCGKLRNI